MAEKWTENQLRAIRSSGEVLVSASAGSGKTSVMTERIVAKIIEGEAHIEEILALTFSCASAESMKQKLEERLVNAYKEATDPTVRAKLMRELDHLPLAMVTTIDSFCQSVVKRYFDKIDVDPSFSLISDREVESYRMRAIKQTIEESTDKIGAYYSILEVLSKKRSDNYLEGAVLRCYDFVQVQPSRDWIARSKDVLGAVSKAEEWLMAYARQEAPSLIRRGEELMQLAGGQILAVEERLDALKLWMKGMNALREALSTPHNYDLRNGNFRFSKSEGEERVAFGEYVNKQAKVWCSDYNDLKSALCAACLPTPSMAEEMVGILEIVERFIEVYGALKRRENKMDFSDVEHACLDALMIDEVRDDVRSRYKLVFVDEYQDVNRLQEAIFSRIACDNCFTVGDVKQSIYAFRHSEPSLFLDRYVTEGVESIDLRENFRTDGGILDFVNVVFGELMTGGGGDVVYAQNPMVAETHYEKVNDLPPVSVSVYLKESTKREPVSGVYSVRDSALSQPAVREEYVDIAQRILKLVKEKTLIYIPKKSTKEATSRELTYSDFAILTRTNKESETISEILVDYGIPTKFVREDNMSRSARVLVDLVRVVVNLRQDIPLASVMLNVFGFDEAELLGIGGKGKEFSERVLASTHPKVVSMLEKISRFRLMSGYMTVGELLRRMTDEVGYRYRVSIRGESYDEVENFIRKIDGSRIGLTAEDFCEGIDTFKLGKSTTSGSDSAVRVMTMHASKGLEFPIVFVAGLGKAMREDGAGEDLVMDKDLGLAILDYDGETRQKSDNILSSVIKLKARVEGVRNETRLLYVALTRAMNHLFVSGTVNNSRNLTFSTSAKNNISRIMATAMHFPESAVVATKVTEDCPLNKKSPEVIDFRQGDREYTDAIRHILSYRYPYEEMTRSGLKYAATRVASLDSESEEYARAYTAYSANLGTLYHRVLEHIPLDTPLGEVERALDGLTEGGVITEYERSLVDVAKVRGVLDSEIVKLARNCETLREKAFVYKIPARRVGVDSDEEVIVQGVVDMLILGEENILVDYKLSGAEEDTLAERYAPQLALYKEAVEQIMGIRVDRCVIFSINRAKAVDIKL